MNVVLLITDQHAHDALGCAGFNNLHTPTFDGLGRDGVRFSQATCAVSPCLPSRLALLNGQYAFQSGVYSNEHWLPPEAVPAHSMGKLFKGAGYQTGAFGKMHLFPYPVEMEEGNFYGFDRRGGYFHETGERMDTHFVAEHRDWMEALMAEREAHGVDRGGDGKPESFIGFRSELSSRQRPDWWVGEQAADFVRDHCDQPFFLVCSTPLPHAPHICPSDFAGLYEPDDVPLPPEPPQGLGEGRFSGIRREDLGQVVANYLAGVTLADRAHGLVVDALKECGIYDETLILFLSDHGELLGSRGPGWMSKYSLYEQAIRVPFIVKPPASFSDSPRGTVCDRPVSLVDVLPTLIAMCEFDVGVELPGHSFLPALVGREEGSSRSLALTELFYPIGDHSVAVRSPEWKWMKGPDGEAVYHIEEDPLEYVNRIDTPEGKAASEPLRDYWERELQRLPQSNRAVLVERPMHSFSIFRD